MSVVGPVRLTVADLPKLVAYYTERLGMIVHSNDGSTARLGAPGVDLLELVEHKGARPAHGATGLFHFAVLLPSRESLARALVHLAETRTPLQGAADHLVSEALYLADPEGNGIELYRDRPREEWAWQGGELRMTTDPLDLDDLFEASEGDRSPWHGLPDGTTMGHIHLRVAHISPAEQFYCELLGFERTTRYGPTASFVSIGGYHHHIAFNTWGGVGAPPPPPGAVGLREFVLRYPDLDQLGRALSRLAGARVPVGEGRLVRDPSGNAVRLAAGKGDFP